MAKDAIFSGWTQRFKSSRGRQIFFGRLAQLVERHPYKVDASGSSPLATTINIIESLSSFLLSAFSFQYAVVVQLVRIPPCHGGGREFESRPPRHSSSNFKNRHILI